MVSFTYATALPAFGPVVGDLGGQPPHRVRMLPRSPDLGPRLARGGFFHVGPPPTVEDQQKGLRERGVGLKFVYQVAWFEL